MGNTKKHVLILENSPKALILNESTTTNLNGEKEYRMGGVFTEFDVMNRNERIYTSDKFLPRLNELIERKNTLGVIYGEFDHPDVFDTSLSRASHVIEQISYNQTKNCVEGQIKLLSTHWGKEAKAIVNDGYPLFVSSRAAGVTESNGTVTVKKLFTYDAVADPGFGSARMHSINESYGGSINESLGFKTNNFRIYDVSDESKINELFMENNNDGITQSMMDDYTKYLDEELKKVKTELTQNIKEGKVDPSKIQNLTETYELLTEQQTKVTKYLDYLAEKVQIMFTENKDLKDTTNKLKEHNDYLVENLNKSIDYSKYLAEQVDKNINYSEYIAETLDKNIDFSEYIAEHVHKNIEFSDYLAENVEKSIDYSEYIAENVDKSIEYGEYIAENVDKSIEYAEYLAENLDKSIEYGEYIAEHVDNNIAYAEYIAEHVDNNIAYSEYIAENVSDSQAYMNYIAEGLDNTMESIKESKIFENTDNIVPQMKVVDDVTKYYDEDDDFVQRPQAQTQTQITQPVSTEPAQDTITQPVEEPVDVQAQVDDQAQVVDPQAQVIGEPVDGQVDGQVGEPGMEEIPTIETPGSIEEQPIMGADVSFPPGETVKIGDGGKTGQVVASNPENNIVVLKVDDTGEIEEFHESQLTLIGDKILETTDQFKNIVGNLITETKKRKASETKDPHFIQFLTEKNKRTWYDLSSQDKEKVIYAINESKTQIYSENQLLNAIKESLTVKVSFEDTLIDNIPASLKPVWDTLNENYKVSVLSQAKLYPNLNTNTKMEKFWESRNLEGYTSINETKQILNENRFIDKNSLSEEEIDSFISKLKNLDK